MKQKKSGAQRVLVRSKDPEVADDPLASNCQAPGRVRLNASWNGCKCVSSYTATYSLDAEGWRPIDKRRPERGCR
jgi:hypothetical protein